jgi:hypothetical protein
MGLLPAPGAGDEDGVRFVTGSLHALGVDTALAELVASPDGQPSLGVPTATIIQSNATGSRTIISSRRGLDREVSPAWFAARLPDVFSAAAPHANGWIHLETREFASVVQLAREARRRLQDVAGGGAWRVSIEVEKPAISVSEAIELGLCADVLFLSRDWAERHAHELVGPQAAAATDDACAPPEVAQTEAADDACAEGGPPSDEHVALRVLRQVACRTAAKGRVLSAAICAWGAHGGTRPAIHQTRDLSMCCRGCAHVPCPNLRSRSLRPRTACCRRRSSHRRGSCGAAGVDGRL